MAKLSVLLISLSAMELADSGHIAADEDLQDRFQIVLYGPGQAASMHQSPHTLPEMTSPSNNLMGWEIILLDAALDKLWTWQNPCKDGRHAMAVQIDMLEARYLGQRVWGSWQHPRCSQVIRVSTCSWLTALCQPQNWSQQHPAINSRSAQTAASSASGNNSTPGSYLL